MRFGDARPGNGCDSASVGGVKDGDGVGHLGGENHAVAARQKRWMPGAAAEGQGARNLRLHRLREVDEQHVAAHVSANDHGMSVRRYGELHQAVVHAWNGDEFDIQRFGVQDGDLVHAEAGAEHMLSVRGYVQGVRPGVEYVDFLDRHAVRLDNADALRRVHGAHGPSRVQLSQYGVEGQHARRFERRLACEFVVPVEFQDGVLADERYEPERPIRGHRHMVGPGVFGEPEIAQVHGADHDVRLHVDHRDYGGSLVAYVEERSAVRIRDLAVVVLRAAFDPCSRERKGVGIDAGRHAALDQQAAVRIERNDDFSLVGAAHQGFPRTCVEARVRCQQRQENFLDNRQDVARKDRVAVRLPGGPGRGRRHDDASQRTGEDNRLKDTLLKIPPHRIR